MLRGFGKVCYMRVTYEESVVWEGMCRDVLLKGLTAGCIIEITEKHLKTENHLKSIRKGFS